MSFPIQLGIYEIINKFFLFILLVNLSPEELREKMKVSFNLSQNFSNSRLLTIPKVYNHSEGFNKTLIYTDF